MRFPRPGDLLLGGLVSAMLLGLWFVPWSNDDEDAARDAGQGALTVEALVGLRLTIDALGGESITLEAARGALAEPGLGPFRMASAPAGLLLEEVRGRFASGWTLRAGHARLGKREVVFEGAVRVDDDEAGVLFASKMELNVTEDRIRLPGIAVLGPRGTAGGEGGETVLGWTGSRAEVAAAAAHARR